MRLLICLVAAVFFVAMNAVSPPPAQAVEVLGASIALHVTEGSAKSPCVGVPEDGVGTPLHCVDYTYHWPLSTPATVYLVVVAASASTPSGSGDIAALSCGINYDAAALGFPVWSLCGDMETPTDGPAGAWPLPGSGNRIDWVPGTNCQTTVAYGGNFPWGDLYNTHAVAGTFYLTAYGDDVMVATSNTAMEPDECYYVDCSGIQYDYQPTGAYVGCAIGFGEGQGESCSKDMPIPVRRSTWGGLKSLY